MGKVSGYVSVVEISHGLRTHCHRGKTSYDGKVNVASVMLRASVSNLSKLQCLIAQLMHERRWSE